MINWARVISVGLISGVAAGLLFLILRRNKNLYEKLNKYFHPDLVVILCAIFLIGYVLGDYLSGKDLLESFYKNLASFLKKWISFFLIILVIDFLVKKFWKKK